MIRVWRVSICLFAAAVLASCAPDRQATYRDTNAPIGATSRFDTSAFTGSWVVVARFAPDAVSTARATITQQAAQLRVTSDDLPEIAGLYRQGIPGELIPITGAAEPLIVMWVDTEFRTAVIGTASGSFGAILNRTPQISRDKSVAAREILAFYGWDISRLKRTGP